MISGTGKGIDEYRKQSVSSASPVQLVVMLYDAAIRNAELGRIAMEGGRIQEQNDHLLKTQRILSELSCSLDMQQGGEVAQNLLGLYTYCLNQLTSANIDDKPEPVREVVKILENLRDAWRQIAESQNEEGAVAA